MRSTASTCASDVSSAPSRGGPDGKEAPMTTLMNRDIPVGYSRARFLEVLDGMGFQVEYDFVHLPMEKGKTVNTGYAFVNSAVPRWKRSDIGFGIVLAMPRNVLNSIEKAGTVQRLVYTSSCAAVMGPAPPGHEFTEDDCELITI